LNYNLDKSLLLIQPAISAGVPFILLPFFISFFDDAQLSTFFLLQVIGNIISQIFSFSIMAGFENLYYKTEKNKSGLISLMSTAIIFNLASMTIFFIFAGEYIFSVLGEWNILLVSGAPILTYVTLYCVANVFEFFLYHLRNENHIKLFFVLASIQHLISLVILVPLAIFYPELFNFGNVISILIIGIAIRIFLSIISMLYMKKFYCFVDILMLRNMFTICWPLIFRIIPNLLQTQFDKIFLIALLGAPAMNLYSIAQKSGTAIQVFYTSLDRIFKPNFYRLRSANSSGISSYVFRYHNIAIGCCLFILFLNPVISVFFLGEINVIFIGMLAGFIAYQGSMFLGKLLGMEFISLGKTHYLLYGSLLNFFSYGAVIAIFHLADNLTVEAFVLALITSSIVTSFYLVFVGGERLKKVYLNPKFFLPYIGFSLYFLPLGLYRLSYEGYVLLGVFLLAIYLLYSARVIYAEN